jgi:hypothetical protein
MYKIHWPMVIVSSCVSTLDLVMTILSIAVITQCTPSFSIQLVSSMFLRQNYENCFKQQRRKLLLRRV